MRHLLLGASLLMVAGVVARAAHLARWSTPPPSISTATGRRSGSTSRCAPDPTASRASGSASPSTAESPSKAPLSTPSSAF